MGKSMHVHNVHVGEIWTAWYPYKEGYKKKRPVLVKGFDEDGNVIVQRMSTKAKYGSAPILYPALERKTFLHNEYATIPPYEFRHMIWKQKGKQMILGDTIPYPDWWERKENNNAKTDLH